jgi:DNA-binding NtrC family response regulator
VGKSKLAQEAREFAEQVAGSELTVLLYGETGTGKDMLAELIHETGRLTKPFVVVDCGALTETLSESELFGHVKGAFTDANQERMGLVKTAEDGTLFFNEVANMSLGLQAKFLRILDKKPFRAVGGRTEIQVRTRIIAATNVDLEEAVKLRTFRLDLFHRLNVLSFSIAPLRQRKDDIPELISVFLNGSAERFSPAALAAMTRYDWPGNVRELINVVQRAVFMNKEKEIGLEQIKRHLAGQSDEAKGKDIDLEQIESHLADLINRTNRSFFQIIDELQRNYVCHVLEVSNGIVKKAADIAGIARQTMNHKIKKFGLRDFVNNLREER